ncbi:hypothetical protein [Mesorhizobium sp. B2-3-5]|uniref:hypothetical protein n=1 Tax=Mesorhizobium sp. B2-3-5 TaxID=2589958 RepID=UPI001128855C|nr:hypothetical protein [Mesorhizobium sp. B2-3-5]TPM34332.1 hypothetical protein FJ958_08105 [Mesorhizobium sp. B2-3-5]
MRQQRQNVSTAVNELAKAVPVAQAIAQLHEAIRRSPASNFWPVIRETKGVLFVRSTDSDQEFPWPWRRTKSGNMSYKLPGYLLFSPWSPNFHRMLLSCMVGLQQVMADINDPESKSDFSVTHLPYGIWSAMLRPKHLIPEIQLFQRFAMPDSIAALDRWSNEPQGGSNIALRISQGALVYNDRSDRCEIKIPEALTKPLFVPSTPDRPLELHLVRVGGRSYYP